MAGRRLRSMWFALLVVGLAAVTVAIALALAKSPSKAPVPKTSERPPPAQGADCPRAKPAKGGGRSDIILGMNSMWDRHCDEARLATAGVNRMRIELTWARVEPRRGRWNWSAFDKKFAIAARSGMTVLPVLFGSPRWATGNENVIPDNPADFAEFTHQVVARYGPNGAFWRSHRRLPYRFARWFEIWNEPYLVNFSADGIHPDRYARLVVAAANAGRAANPAARFLIEADTQGINEDGSYTPWVQGMYDAVPDLSNYFDAVAVHPYSSPGSPDEYTPGGDTRSQFRRVGQIKQAFADRGAGKKPFWITEIGWPTCPDKSAGCVSERDQAHYTSRAFQILRSEFPFVRAVFIYNYRDAATDPSNKEDWFGVFRSGGQAKPVWNVIARRARGL
jgi:hypothetical protein